MIDRPQGFTAGDYRMTEINLYPTPTVYVENDEDYDNPLVEEVWDWANMLCRQAKDEFPFCRFEVISGIHDGDYRVYAEIRIFSANGSHSDAAEWLKYKAA